MAGRLISIISPVLNEEKYLAQMIESVLRQTYRDWELVLVDDGSTDGTVDIIEGFAAEEPRIRLVQKEHGGVCMAFSEAFAQSRGDIIVHCGGDDHLPPDSLESRVEVFRRYPRASKIAVFSKIRMFWDDGSRGTQVVPRGTHGSRSSPGYAMTRELADLAFPIPDGLVSDDPWVGEVAYAMADHVVHLPTISVNYRIHPGNHNPRHLDFEELNSALFDRARAIACLLESDRHDLSEANRARLEALWLAETRCHDRRPIKVLATRGLSVSDRLALTAAASPTLTRIRNRFYGSLSGWRGR